jgi:hypothetical protein
MKEDWAVETMSIQTNPDGARVEERFMVFYSVRVGGLRFCRRGFNRRLIFM